MNILNISILCIVGTLLSVYMKNTKPEYSTLIAISLCIIIIAYSVGKLSIISGYLSKLNETLGIEKKYFGILIKMIGITYISEFSADICKDAGHQAIASQIQIFGKLTIMAVSMPVFVNLLDTIYSLI